MKTSWMINNIFRKILSRHGKETVATRQSPIECRLKEAIRSPRSLDSLARTLLVLFALTVIPFKPVAAANPPKELQRIMDNFMNLEATSMEILQVIDWKYKGGNDSVRFQIDIQGSQRFHLELYAFGLEIFVGDGQMMTVNHIRRQIIHEDATADALLKQLFAGGNLNDARFKEEQDLADGKKELKFRFDVDFSDWESLSIVLDEEDHVNEIKLVDYDGNLYTISFRYLERYSSFEYPNLENEYVGYKLADLRQ